MLCDIVLTVSSAEKEDMLVSYVKENLGCSCHFLDLFVIQTYDMVKLGRYVHLAFGKALVVDLPEAFVISVANPRALLT